MTTSNLKGEKLSKNDLQIHLIGTLDELNACLGLVKVRLQDTKDKKFIETIQTNIMKMMSHVSDNSDKNYFFSEENVSVLDNDVNRLKEKVGEESEFALPGNNETEALIHIARTVARRAERYFAAVNEQIPLCEYGAVYINKLSDYLFYLSKL